MRLIFWLLVALVILAPLPLGARDMWAWSLIAVAVALLNLAWAALVLLRPGRHAAVEPRRYWLPAALYFAAIGWALVQASGWTPAAWDHPAWQLAADGLGASAPGSLSVNPFATVSAAVRLASWAGVFFLALQLGRSPANARAAVHALAIAAAAYAFYGLLIEFSGGGQILWFAKKHYLQSLTSTFHYKNAYATYAGFGLICLAVVFLRAYSRAMDPGLGRAERVRRLFAGMLATGWPALAAFVIVAMALVQADSRGAVIGAGAALFAILVVQRFARADRVPGGAVIAVVLAVGGFGVLAFSGDTVMGKFAERADVRTEVYRLTLGGISERPVTGTGLGTFRDAFREVRTTRFVNPAWRAHNSYLDNAWGLGIPAAALLFAAIALIAWRCFAGAIARNRDALYPAMGAGAAVLAGVHAFFDFTFQFAAVSVTFAFMLGIGYAQSWSTRDGGAGGEPGGPDRPVRRVRRDSAA